LDQDTRLLRQVSPSWLIDGRITSQVFRPTPKDEGLLSTYDGDRITPCDAWEHFTTVLNFQSVGVVAVTVSECASMSLPVHTDEKTNFREHVVIDFRSVTTNRKMERLSKDLKMLAMRRGWLHEEVL
jgi:hypothetical protein